MSDPREEAWRAEAEADLAEMRREPDELRTVVGKLATLSNARVDTHPDSRRLIVEVESGTNFWMISENEADLLVRNGVPTSREFHGLDT